MAFPRKSPLLTLFPLATTIRPPHDGLTFADEALLGDGLLAYVTALGLLEWLQLEGVRVDALQLVGLTGEEEERERERDQTPPGHTSGFDK